MHRLLIILLAAQGVALATPDNQAKLKASKANWSALKLSCNGNYQYTVETESWVGHRTRTEVLVEKNVVVKRRHLSAGLEQPAFKLEWEEVGDALGSHKWAAPAKTMDELYAEAATILARTLKHGEDLYVKFDSRGLLQHCFYVDTRIADDSPTIGVNLASLTLAKP